MEIDWNTIAAATGITTALGGTALAVHALLLAEQAEKRLREARDLWRETLKKPHLCRARDCVHHCETDFRCDKSEPIISRSAHCDSYCPRPEAATQPKEN